MHFETVIGLEVHVELKQTQNVLSITSTFWRNLTQIQMLLI